MKRKLKIMIRKNNIIFDFISNFSKNTDIEYTQIIIKFYFFEEIHFLYTKFNNRPLLLNL